MAEEKRKTLLFLCNCGTNIADFLDMEAVADWALRHGDVAVVERHNLLCAPDGNKFFKEILSREKPENVVVAACSPKMHEATFQGLAEEVGMNMSRVQMANIREHCAWVTTNPDEATSKAQNLINAAVRRSWLSEDLEKRTAPANPDILVIGGGIAGIEAALTASKDGRKVYVVDREISLGGSVIKYEELAPNMECAACLLAPRLAEIKDCPNVTVITNAEVTDVLGFYGNFTVKIRKKARFVEDSCIGCEACFEVCPVSVKNDFHLGMGTRKAIYSLFLGSVPPAAVIDKANCKHFTDGSCSACVEACSFKSINFEQQDENIEVDVGAVFVATGFDSGDPSGIEGLGYGKIDDVYSLPEFERIASSNGPSGGNILLKNGEPPTSVAVVHCVGSMCDDAIPYCSGTCCTTAMKVGELVRKQVPNAKVCNIYNDLVIPHPREYAFYRKQIEEGTEFIKCLDLKSVEVSRDNGKIKVKGSGIDTFEVDMVVLVTGLKPAAGTPGMAEMLDIELEKDGFFSPDHVFLHATGTSLDGIYVAGCAAGPCDIATAVTRAKAAAGDALSKLVPGREIELEIMTSVINEEICSGCKLCISVCPYKAVYYDEEKNISVVNENICRGCGTCTASCPSGAAKSRHFTDGQIYAEIGGLINV